MLPFLQLLRLTVELTFALLVAQQKRLGRFGYKANVWQHEVAPQQLFLSLALGVDEARVECEQFAIESASQLAVDQLKFTHSYEVGLLQHIKLGQREGINVRVRERARDSVTYRIEMLNIIELIRLIGLLEQLAQSLL